LQLDNNPASAAFLWQFARETYREFKENGVWDAATQTIDGSSFFGTIRCWNCDGPHNVQECPEAIDNDRVDRN